MNQAKKMTKARMIKRILISLLLVALPVVIVIPNIISSKQSSEAGLCRAILKQLHAAKGQWVRDAGMPENAVPKWSDLIGTYLKTKPECPAGGTYSLDDVKTLPTCSVGSNKASHYYDDHIILAPPGHSTSPQQVPAEILHVENHENIIITGEKKFINQVKDALELLKTKAPEDLSIIQRYVKNITQSEKSGMDVHSNSPTFRLAKRSAFYSVTWCASVIAHDAYHSKLYSDYKKQNKSAPRDAWTGQDAEKKCLSYQIKVANRISAPQHEVEHLQSMDGTHYDIDRDGDHDKDDMDLMNW